MHIMSAMLEDIPEPNAELSPYAPRIITMQVQTDQIRTIIGKGGETINGIIDRTGVKIDINDEGMVFIASPDGESLEAAKKEIEMLVKEPEPGEIYEGKVTRIMNFGAFVEILPGKEGLIHISKIAKERIDKVEDVLKVGDTVNVKYIGLDSKGRMDFSIRDAMPGVDYIFHAAALKQVPSCEFFPMQAVQTNIIGTDNVLHAAIDAGVKRVVCLSTDKAAYPINAMGISKAMMEHVIYANARVAAERGGTTICCTRYGNVMCSRGSVIPLFIDQIKAGNPITITDPNMTRFLMNLDEAVDLVLFAFQHANPGDLFIQKSDASTIGDLAKAVQQLFGDTGTNIIGTRHGEKLFETLMTREERLRSEDMGHYFRVAADNRDLNYDKFVVKGEVHTMADESYTSHNTERLDVEGTVKKIMTTEYVQNALKEDQ